MTKNESVALRILQDYRLGLFSRRKAAELMCCTERSVTRRAKKI